MNLLSKVNFSWRDSTKKQVRSGEVLLFSGFLIALLGTTGMQITAPEAFYTENSKSAGSKNLCQEHIGVKAIMADSTLAEVEGTSKKSDKPEEKVSKDCQHQKQIGATLEAEITLSGGEEKAPLVEDEKEKLYQARVKELEGMLGKHPLAKMASEIAKQDPEIAALIVGIARKESQWGVRSPKKNGDCFNYWGFKGAGDRGTGMGYACFATREEAIERIANRLEKLVDKRGSSKPSALVTPWKCGSSCAGHSKESVNKWVSDVNQYYVKVLAIK